ncbi:hypothetical protein RclHR1_05630002 [Rhizophagus clarus]|uniref:Uncharacterized protein n=1 Tax=Rhizophagus clarus TaxID=94130 RepID=A0A2Z6S0T8_9GLOM|nr:hypothetical protein RclHR1_05630002 [Rhizophagus clarus]GES91816.1 hypothetical protein GLOIN_2v1687124 [Rhizophagus clarus]
MESVEREDGSRRFRIIRYIIGGLLTLIYVTYVSYLTYGIATDKLTLKVEQNFLDQVDVPDMKICGTTQEMTILRCDLIMKNDKNNKIDYCSDYISPTTTNLGDRRECCYTFKANKTIKYANPDKHIDGLKRIGFYFYENKTAAEEKVIGIASLSIQLLSPDFDPFVHPEKAVSDMDKATQSELELQWNFIAGMSNYAALVKFKTSVYNAILPSDASATIGFEPNYHTTLKIESLTDYFPFNSNPYNLPNGTTGYFSVAAGSFIQESMTEQRSSTILSAIESAGGALGVIGGIAVLLRYSYNLIKVKSLNVSAVDVENPEAKAEIRNLSSDQLNLNQNEQAKLIRTSNIFTVDDEDPEEAKAEIRKLSPDRLNLNQNERAKLIEHELSEIKSVIKRYLLEHC